MNELPDYLVDLIKMFWVEPFMTASVRKSLGTVPNIFTSGQRGDVLRMKLEVHGEAFRRNEMGKKTRTATKKVKQ